MEFSEMDDDTNEIKTQYSNIGWMNEESQRRHSVFDQIKSITDKSKCFDIFQKTKIYRY